MKWDELWGPSYPINFGVLWFCESEKPCLCTAALTPVCRTWNWKWMCWWKGKYGISIFTLVLWSKQIPAEWRDGKQPKRFKKQKLKAVASSPRADPGGGLPCQLSLHWALLFNGQPHCRLCCISGEMTLPLCSFCWAESTGGRQDHYQHPAAGRFCSLSDQLTWHTAIFTVRE